jgi:hypothetical protein
MEMSDGTVLGRSVCLFSSLCEVSTRKGRILNGHRQLPATTPYRTDIHCRDHMSPPLDYNKPL